MNSMRRIIAAIALALVPLSAPAGVTIRYFSNTSAGAGDGTTWNDRAALFSAGNWSSIITGFDFTSTNSLLCLVGPGSGSYTCSQSLTDAIITTGDPSAANPLMFHGCDSSGNMLTPPDDSWTADTVFTDTGFPVIATTTNIATATSSHTSFRLIKFTASGRTGGPVLQPDALGCVYDWIVLENSSNNASAVGIADGARITNSYIYMSGAAYSAGLTPGNNDFYDNVRVRGVTGSSGNRHGIAYIGTTVSQNMSRICSFGNGGAGVASTSSNAAQSFRLVRSVIANNGGSGVIPNSTASQTRTFVVGACMITGNGAYGINAQSAGNVFSLRNRLRDNASNNFNGFGNYPTDFGNYTTDSDDSSEYVDAAAFDFRIKNTATIWGMGFGISEQSASGGGQRGYSF